MKVKKASFPSEKEEEVTIVGNICESGDILAKDRKLPEIFKGDIFGILDAGAYGFTMASNYNSRPLASEILVTDGKCNVVRERETFEDLYDKQIIPPHLK